jgi:hypothetical protein
MNNDKRFINIISKKSGETLPIYNIFLDDSFEEVKKKLFISDLNVNGIPYFSRIVSFEISKIDSSTEIEEQEEYLEEQEFEEEGNGSVEELEIDKDEEYLIIDDDIEEEYIPIEKEKKMVLSDENYQIINLNELSPIYFAFNSLVYSNPKIYITHLYDYILDTIKLKEVNISKKELFENVKQKFINVTENDFENIYNLTGFSQRESEYTSELNILKDEEKRKVKKSEFDKYIIQNEGIPSYFEFYKNTDVSSFVQTKDNIPLFKFNSVSLKIVGKSIIDFAERFIYSDVIFNTFQLTDLVPFMAIMSGTVPLVKIYKNIDVVERDLRSWVINEKKKDHQITFRKFRGVTFYMYIEEYERYLHVNILENGIIYTKIDLDQEEDIEKVIEIIKNYLDDLITILNKNTKFFKVSKKIDYIKDSNINIKSIDATIDTKNQMVHKAAFNEFISLFPEIFNVKDTSNEMISMFYKKINYKNKNVTINIKDHLYEKDKSTINIFTAPHIMSLVSIISHISSIVSVYSKIVEVQGITLEPEKQQLRSKQEIQQQKQMGAEVDSRRCQSIKRPDILKQIPDKKPSTYFLKYKNKIYSCENRINVDSSKKSYPYPGFADPMIPCCYVKDARKSLDVSKYTVSSDYLDIPYQPSNVQITVNHQSQTYTTFIIRRIDISDVIHYFFIDENNKLVEIENEELIEQFNYKDDIWFAPIALSFLLGKETYLYPYESKAKKVPVYKNENNKPKFSARSSDNINSMCEKKSKNKYFGYDKDSIPKCFKTPELPSPSFQQGYIKENTKNPHLLNYNELGKLYSIMDTLFNEQIKNPNGIYLRYGIQQNRSSILNVFFIISRRLYAFNSKQQFEEYVFSNLTDDLFRTLNGGFISNTFDDNDNFKDYLKNPNKNIKWSEVVDLMYKIFKINTLVFDIPFFDKTNNIDIQGIKLLCNWYVQNDIQKAFRENEKFIILLKRRDTYEIICLKNEKDNSIEFIFDNTNSMLEFCLGYYSETCQILEEYPEEYSNNYSTKRISVNYLVDKLKSSDFQIESLVVNSFNKVNYVQLKNNGALLVVKESGIIENLPIIDLSKIDLTQLPSLDTYLNIISKINTYLDDEYHYKIIGVVQNENKKINAVMSNLNFLIPISESEYTKKELPILSMKYNHNPDETLTANNGDKLRTEYNKENKQLEKEILSIKIHLGKVFAIDDKQKDNVILVEDLKRKVKELIPRSDKFNYIYTRLYKITLELKKREQEEYEKGNIKYEQLTLNLDNVKLVFILHHITNEVINDTNEQLLLNNVILSLNEKEKKFIERQTEVLFDDVYDFLDWTKNKYSTNEE